MSKLGLIVKNEYLTEIRSKSFWLTTILVPVLFAAFSLFVGFMALDNENLQNITNPTAPDPDEMSGAQVAGMMVGLFLALFLMTYGAQIYNKVRKEKVNRIMEVLATCVPGRTMMFGKVISVALIGITQLAVWASVIAVILAGVFIVFQPDLPWHYLGEARVWTGLFWSVLFFIGGYVFYGSIYAACGAMTDKDAENQGYMTVLTFLLLGSFYIEQYAVNHPSNIFVTICSFIPFTSPAVATVNALCGDVPLWQTILSAVVLYAFAWLSTVFSGKIYTASIMLKGKKFSPRDILLFLKMK